LRGAKGLKCLDERRTKSETTPPRLEKVPTRATKIGKPALIRERERDKVPKDQKKNERLGVLNFRPRGRRQRSPKA